MSKKLNGVLTGLVMTGIMRNQGLTVGIGSIRSVANSVDSKKISVLAAEISKYTKDQLNDTVLNRIALELSDNTAIDGQNRINLKKIAESVPFFSLISKIIKSTSAATDTVKRLPGAITGIINEDIINTNAIHGVNVYQNLTDNIIHTSHQYDKSSIAQLINIIAAAKTFVDQSLQNHALALATSKVPEQDLTYNNATIFDQITVGVLNNTYTHSEISTSQLTTENTLSVKLQQQAVLDEIQNKFQSLAVDLKRFGRMYDITKLDTCFTALGLMQNLIAQGVNLRSFFAELGLTYSANTMSDEKSIMRVLASVKGSRLQQIKDAVNFTAPVSDLSQALDVKMVLSAASLGLVGDFAGLRKRIENIGPNFAQSFSQLAQTIQQIELPKASDVLGLESDVSQINELAEITDDIKYKIGRGSGKLKNPMMEDVLASATGSSYNHELLTLIHSQNQILTTPLGQELYSTLEKFVKFDGDNDSEALIIEEYSTIPKLNKIIDSFLNQKEPLIKENLALCAMVFQTLSDRVINEKLNTRAARIDLNNSDPGSEIGNAQSFISLLENASDGTEDTGLRKFIEDLTSTDLVGDAIKALIVENKNARVMRNLGVFRFGTTVANVINALEEEQIVNDSLCCGAQIAIDIVPSDVPQITVKPRVYVNPKSAIWFIGSHLEIFPKNCEWRLYKTSPTPVPTSST